MSNVVTKIGAEMKAFLYATLAIAVYAVFVNLLAWKYQLITGGSVGYALIINYLIGYSVGTILLVANTILIFIAVLLAGARFGVKTIYGYITLSIFTDLSRHLLGLSQTQTNAILLQIINTGLFGIIGGLAVAIIISQGYSVGGYTALVPIAKRYAKLTPPQLMLILDSALVLITLFIFGFDHTLALVVNAGAFFLSLRASLQIIKNRNEKN